MWSTRWASGDAPPGTREFVPVLLAGAVSVWVGTAVPFLAVLGSLAAIMGVSRWSARATKVAEPTWTGALLMGVAQSLAILPGISRSGSTVVTGLWRRIDAVAAAEFSFLMSVPAILGAGLLSLPELAGEGVGVSGAAVLAGAVAAEVTGVLAIRFFVALLERQSFHAFAWYCWIAGALFLTYVRGGG